MSLLLGTENGLRRFDATAGEVSRLTTDEVVLQVEAGQDGKAYAATDDGVSRIDGDTVESLGLEGEAAVSIHETATGDLYAGTRPAHVYRSADDGGTWERLDSFERIPGKEDWTQNYMGPAQVRDIRTHERAPWRLFVAVETDGVYLSMDAGRTWAYRGRGLDNDPHGLRFLGQDSLVATCGRGLYRTDDAGELWYRLDTHQRHFWFQYFREGICHDGVYYTCVMDRSTHRYRDVNEGRILRSTDGGTTLEEQAFPGQDDDYVTAWATDGDRVYAGTAAGRLLRGPGEWVEVAAVESAVRSLGACRALGDPNQTSAVERTQEEQ